MNQEYLDSLDIPRQQAVRELTELIRQYYPTVSFEITPGWDDPHGTYILATVDTDDPDEVTDLVLERELALQIDEGIPVYVLPLRTPERVAELLRQQQRQSILPPSLPA